jgi:stearoyl-CoA desaturase (delta-9 desaturase)
MTWTSGSAAWVILVEGLQNNHHAYPASAKFSTRPVELDLGWHIARGLEALGVLRIEWDLLIPEVTREAWPTRQDRAA